MRLLNWIILLIKTIFPFIDSISANKKIRKRILNIEGSGDIPDFEYMKGYEKLNCDDVDKLFNKTLDVKNSLEDKLKTSLFSITIGITVLTSTASFLFSAGISSLSTIYKSFIFFTASISVIYMILAGIFSIRTISGFISFHELSPEDISNSEKKKSLAICAELNSLSNIIRQNLMNVSFRCIINSLFVISLFFFLVGISSFLDRNKVNSPSKLEVSVQQNKRILDKISAELDNQKNTNAKILETLFHNDISKINNTIENLIKQVDNNQKEIRNLKNNIENSYNKSLYMDENSPALRCRR